MFRSQRNGRKVRAQRGVIVPMHHQVHQTLHADSNMFTLAFNPSPATSSPREQLLAISSNGKLLLALFLDVSLLKFSRLVSHFFLQLFVFSAHARPPLIAANPRSFVSSSDLQARLRVFIRRDENRKT